MNLNKGQSKFLEQKPGVSYWSGSNLPCLYEKDSLLSRRLKETWWSNNNHMVIALAINSRLSIYIRRALCSHTICCHTNHIKGTSEPMMSQHGGSKTN
eukprot:scaffold385754_cov24-Prasinocladus_malaysianus.AAC.1